MNKVYVLSEKQTNEEEWKIVGVIADFDAASAFLNVELESGYMRRWQGADFNSPELLDRIAKEGR